MPETISSFYNFCLYFDKKNPAHLEAAKAGDEWVKEKGLELLEAMSPSWYKQPEASKLVTQAQAEHVFENPIYDAELADLNACCDRFEINTPARLRHFMAQIAHESGGLKWLKELATGDDYEWRADLGNTQPGDGRRFKGAGAIQLTGRYNYQAFADFIGDPRVMEGVDYVSKVYPFSSAGFFWYRNEINQAIDNGANIYAVTRIVNGGLNGIEDRKRYFSLAREVF